MTILCLLTATAQDIIVKVDGDTLKVYDLKINAKFITYREKPGKESPSRRIGRAKVLSVKKRNCKSVTISKPAPAPVIVQQLAENQKKETIVYVVDSVSADSVEKSPKKPKGEIKRETSADNAQFVAAYNKNHSSYGDKKQKSKKTGRAVAIMGVTTGSVLANEDVTVEILKSSEIFQYEIFVQNRGDKIIYLDLENCFRIYNDGTFKPYYSGRQIRQNKQSNSKLSFSNKSTVSRPQYTEGRKTTTGGATFTLEDKRQTSQVVKEQKILAVPPKGKVALPPCVTLDEYENIVEKYDIFSATLSDTNYLLRAGDVVNIDEQQTPYKNSFIITYSPNKNFETYSTVKFGLVLRQLIGLGTKFSRFDETLIHGYDRYTVCGEIYFE